MKTLKLGRTGLDISPLCVGCMSFGEPARGTHPWMLDEDASRVILRPDFCEGVRAVIVDKDNAPKWNPPTVAGVAPALLDAIFAPLPTGEEWTPL